MKQTPKMSIDTFWEKTASSDINYEIPETSSQKLDKHTRAANAQQRIYDLYFLASLDLNDPKGAEPNPLKQSLKKIKNDLIDTMLRDYMSDLRFCVAAELRHVWDGNGYTSGNTWNELVKKVSNLNNPKSKQTQQQIQALTKTMQELLAGSSDPSISVQINSINAHVRELQKNFGGLDKQSLQTELSKHIRPNSAWEPAKIQSWKKTIKPPSDYVGDADEYISNQIKTLKKEWQTDEVRKMAELLSSPSPSEWQAIINKTSTYRNFKGINPANISERYQDCSEDRKKCYLSSINAGLSNKELAIIATYLFAVGEWSSSLDSAGFGGPRWAVVAKTIAFIEDVLKEDKLDLGENQKLFAVDLVHGLQHNGGPAINKVVLYSGGTWLAETLDFKAETSDPMEFMKKSSAVLHVAKPLVEQQKLKFKESLSKLDQLTLNPPQGSSNPEVYKQIKEILANKNTNTLECKRKLCTLISNYAWNPVDIQILTPFMLDPNGAGSLDVARCLGQNTKIKRESRTALFKELTKAIEKPEYKNNAGEALSVFLESQPFSTDLSEGQPVEVGTSQNIIPTDNPEKAFSEIDMVYRNTKPEMLQYLAKNPVMPADLAFTLLGEAFENIEAELAHKEEMIQKDGYYDTKGVSTYTKMDEEGNPVQYTEKWDTPYQLKMITNKAIVTSLFSNKSIEQSSDPHMITLRTIIDGYEFPEDIENISSDNNKVEQVEDIFYALKQQVGSYLKFRFSTQPKQINGVFVRQVIAEIENAKGQKYTLSFHSTDNVIKRFKNSSPLEPFAINAQSINTIKDWLETLIDLKEKITSNPNLIAEAIISKLYETDNSLTNGQIFSHLKYEVYVMGGFTSIAFKDSEKNASVGGITFVGEGISVRGSTGFTQKVIPYLGNSFDTVASEIASILFEIYRKHSALYSNKLKKSQIISGINSLPGVTKGTDKTDCYKFHADLPGQEMHYYVYFDAPSPYIRNKETGQETQIGFEKGNVQSVLNVISSFIKTTATIVKNKGVKPEQENTPLNSKYFYNIIEKDELETPKPEWGPQWFDFSTHMQTFVQYVEKELSTLTKNEVAITYNYKTAGYIELIRAGKKIADIITNINNKSFFSLHTSQGNIPIEYTNVAEAAKKVAQNIFNSAYKHQPQQQPAPFKIKDTPGDDPWSKLTKKKPQSTVNMSLDVIGDAAAECGMTYIIDNLLSGVVNVNCSINGNLLLVVKIMPTGKVSVDDLISFTQTYDNANEAAKAIKSMYGGG